MPTPLEATQAATSLHGAEDGGRLTGRRFVGNISAAPNCRGVVASPWPDVSTPPRMLAGASFQGCCRRVNMQSTLLARSLSCLNDHSCSERETKPSTAASALFSNTTSTRRASSVEKPKLSPPLATSAGDSAEQQSEAIAERDARKSTRVSLAEAASDEEPITSIKLTSNCAEDEETEEGRDSPLPAGLTKTGTATADEGNEGEE